ncbi:hypothetical protein MOB47_06475 [Bacillus inaquosorum]|uniref:hypothetical protein n=1 Tax=Bacillus inaquosorum TaxID=483913 RepID=UPI0022825488|nr:hypothetical protein [Bacillus inaquosorum]MCY8029139.1 hypothetical protein [Bacillus inaquosorum]MCY8870346.1 hypothetical protein [Bacillus inaquosorum]MCY8994889.1 hypothetical protein [Bacillus inaquosorum]MCY9095173.1 hypothetical protein [Bacillus inaquosorum]
MKFKISIENIFLFFFISIICLFAFSYENYQLKKNLIEKVSNDFYSEASEHLIIKGLSRDILKNIYSSSKKNFILYKENINPEDNRVRAVILSGNIKSPPIIQGRFFQNTDFFKNKKIAVIGSGVDVKKLNNGDECYVFEDECYKVIGRIGTKFKSKLNTFVYLNLDEVDSASVSYVLEEKKSENKLFAKASNKNLDIKIIDSEIKGTGRYLKQDRLTYILISLLLLVIMVMNIFICQYWLYKKSITIAISFLIGIPDRYVYMSLFRKYITLIFLSVIPSSLICNLYTYINFKNEFYDNIIFTMLLNIILIIINCVFFVFCFILYSRMKKIKVLR